MNVTELARRLKLSTDVTRHIIPRVGFDIGLKAIKVQDKIAHQIIEKVKKNPHVIKEVEIELGLRKAVTEETKEKSTGSKGIIAVPEIIAVRDLAQLLHIPVTDVVKELMKNGIFANLNEDIDFETATIIAEDLGFSVQKSKKDTSKKEIASDDVKKMMKEDKEKTTRPPVIVIMGHVDHGKTMLLDAIRESKIVDDEAGGITQHIGAYQIEHKGRKITFIDTPGHEAFTAMRSRGANVADIAILVIAWDDGIKPQTQEALNIIKKMNLPFIVAITKMDKPGANDDKVLQQLAEINYLPEKWGGQTTAVPISAKTKVGLDELLNILLLRADIDAETITADAKRPAVGTVIESNVDKGEGPVATVIVQAGTLRNGDLITAGQVAGKVKLLKDDRGNSLREAPPGTPVKILGLKELPQVGDILQVTSDKKKLKETLKTQKIRAMQVQERRSAIKKQAESGSADNTRYTIILKTDNLGTQEAIEESLQKLPQEDVKVQIVRKGLGNINESDVAEAAGTGAVVYGFHVSVPPVAQEQADNEHVTVRTFDIIYKLIEDIIQELELRLPAEVTKTIEGRMTVSALFRKKGKSQIVGGRIEKGKAKNGLKVKVIRRDIEVGVGKAEELRIETRIVEEIPKGTEFGVKISGAPDIEVGDTIEFFSETSRKRKLIES